LITKLKGKKYISGLFLKGKRLKRKPLQLIFREVDNTKIGVSVPKKKVALAAKRNRLKRQMREAIRLNPKIDQLKNNYHMMWIYDDESASCDFKKISYAVEQIIKKLKENE
jgi:ribonuclease P protein component